MATLLANLHPSRWFTGLWLKLRLPQALGIAHDRPLRRPGHVPRAAAHGGADAERLALRGGRAHGPRSPSLSALRALRRRAGGPRAQAPGDHRVRRGPRRSRSPRSRRARGWACSRWRCSTCVGFLIGLLTVIGWPAYQVFMTERVGRENLVEANAKIGLADSAAQLMGPGLAGALIQWLTAPFAIALRRDLLLLFRVDAARHSAGRHRRAQGRARARCASEIIEGLRVVWHNRILRAIVWSIGLVAGVPPRVHRDRRALRRARAGLLRGPRGRALHGGGPGIARRRERDRAAERALRHGPDDAGRASRERASRGS